jgi:hypothetical protein
MQTEERLPAFRQPLLSPPGIGGLADDADPMLAIPAWSGLDVSGSMRFDPHRA